MRNFHVLPLNDLMVHHESDDCPCNPVRDAEFQEVLIHNAYDGRDFAEQLSSPHPSPDKSDQRIAP